MEGTITFNQNRQKTYVFFIIIACIINVYTSIGFSEEVSENVEVITENETSGGIYDKFLIESLQRRIINIIDDSVIIDNKPRVLIELLQELQDVHDTSELLDEYPKIHKLIFSYH